MITGELKNKVDRLWEMFWTGGITNPLDVIEQITYLMFIRDLDEMDNARKKDSVMLGLTYESIFAEKEYLKWSSLRDKPADTMYQSMQGEVFPFIKRLHTNNGSTQTTVAPTRNTWKMQSSKFLRHSFLRKS